MTILYVVAGLVLAYAVAVGVAGLGLAFGTMAVVCC